MHIQTANLLSRRTAARALATKAVALVTCAAWLAADAGGYGGIAYAAQEAAIYAVSVGGGRITLAKTEWREMENEAAFARNFEATSNPPTRKYQILTVFMIPMSADWRVGERLSPNEYLEVFTVLPRQVVV